MADPMRHALLTPAEEKTLGTTVQRGQRAEELLGRGHDDVGLRREIRAGRKAVQTLVVHNVRLVADLAKRRRTSHLTFDDHLQNGVLGLIRAAEKFDPNAGTRFSTYATWWIRQSMDRGVANQERAIRLPVHVYDWARRVRSARRELRCDDVAVLARVTGLSDDQVASIVPHLSSIGSLDEPVVGSLALTSLIAADEGGAGSLDDELLVLDLLSTLDERSRSIIEARFGLLDGEPRTLDEIGRDYGLTRERIRQIQQKALAALRGAAASQGVLPRESEERSETDGVPGTPGSAVEPTESINPNPRRRRVIDAVRAAGGRLAATEALAAAGVSGARYLENLADADAGLPPNVARLQYDGTWVTFETRGEPSQPELIG